MEVDEVLAGINRTDVKYPFLVLEGYSYEFTDNKSDNLLKNRRGAFILVDHVPDNSDYDAIQKAWDNMEEIGDEILRKILADKRNPLFPVVRDFEISGVETQLLASDVNNDYGVRFSYTITSAFIKEPNLEKWF